MRILPRAGHCFCATLILSPAISAAAILFAAAEMMRSGPAVQKRNIRSFVEDNGLRIERAFSYNPKVFRDRMIPGVRNPGRTGTKIDARNLSEEKPE
jgi:hypothetical protein